MEGFARFTCLTVCNCDCSFSILSTVNGLCGTFQFFLALTDSAAINTLRGVGLLKRKKKKNTLVQVFW